MKTPTETENKEFSALLIVAIVCLFIGGAFGFCFGILI